MQKVRYHIQYIWLALTACMIADSGSISPVIDLLFHLSLTVLFTIATSSILSLRGWYPDFHASYLSHYCYYIFTCASISSTTYRAITFFGLPIPRYSVFDLFNEAILSYFARHYFRSHGCFPFLQLLRWFSSLRFWYTVSRAERYDHFI